MTQENGIAEHTVPANQEYVAQMRARALRMLARAAWISAVAGVLIIALAIPEGLALHSHAGSWAGAWPALLFVLPGAAFGFQSGYVLRKTPSGKRLEGD